MAADAPVKPQATPEESVPELAKEITEVVRRLVMLEIELIKAQALAVVKRAAIGAGFGVAALIAFLFFVGQGIGTLSELSGQWFGWLIGTVVLLLVTVVFAVLAVRLIMRAVNQGKEIFGEVGELPEVAKETVAQAQQSWRRTGGQP